LKLRINQQDLNLSLSAVQRAVSTKTTLPILTGIFLEATGDTLTVRATDMEVAIQYQLACQVDEEGKLVVPGKYLLELVKKLPENEIILEKPGNTNSLTIFYENSQVTIYGYDPDEFPNLPQFENELIFLMDPPSFTEMIKKVTIAASHDESRPLFTGTLWESQGNSQFLVSTDTHRLAYYRNVVQDPIPDFSVVISSRTLMEAARLMSDFEEPIQVALAKSQICFKNNFLAYHARYLEGQFPDYQQVIPKEFSGTIRVNSNKLHSAVERAALLSRNESNKRANIIKLMISDDCLIITSNTPEVGQINEEISCYYDGEPMEIGFNARYLLDVLKVLDAEELYFKVTGPTGPAIIEPIGQDNFTYLVLPVRLI